MKKIVFLVCLALISNALFSNNIQVSNISLTGQNTTNKTVQVQFTVSWENSWRISAGPGNWDAAWAFVKFRKGANGLWSHASLMNTGQVVPAGSTITPGLADPAAAFNIATNPVVGAFVYRNVNGAGTFTAANAQLRWHYGQDGLADVDVADIQVFAIEMVYVPQGAFAAGDGKNNFNQFTITTINTPNPLLGPSGIGSLGGQAGGYPSGQLAPSNAGWPNGFNAFYMMKYEISQQGYVDFLNALTRSQQAARVTTALSPGFTTTSFRFVMVQQPAPSARNGISCFANFQALPPLRFFCDLNNNNRPGDINDGRDVACNAISWADVAAYLAWSGLRPLTELEYEKAGRGNLSPVSGEFAWGTTYAARALSITDDGMPTEEPGSETNCNFAGALAGPLRVGSFSGAGSSREMAGAGYYGAMELSGNLWERCVSMGSSAGRSFGGTHGSGKLDAQGNPLGISDWPSFTTADGTISRGGGIISSAEYCELSNRWALTNVEAVRWAYNGGRGGRTAQ
jgi:formylglycine-generating enzyme required for sulfatase activity